MSNTPNRTSPDHSLRLRGKVADIADRISLKNVQVVIFGNPQEPSPTVVAIGTVSPATPDLVPLAIGYTDAYGSFSVDFPRGKYSEAFAIISTAPDERVSIALEADGTFPKFVFLILETLDRYTDQAAHDDCACKGEQHIPRLPDAEDLVANSSYTQDIGGSCNDFTTPNRALEEFPFYKVVRTSDPVIITPETKAELTLLDETIKKQREKVLRLQEDVYAHQPQYSMGEAPDGAVKKSGATQKGLVTEGGKNTLLDAGDSQQYDPAQSLREAQTKLNALISDRTDFLNNLPERKELSVVNTIDWDETPTLYQATTIAHGHLLEFRQVWKADGYSLGDLLYSLPLAPGQKRQIAIHDWDRTDEASRSEIQSQADSLSNQLSNDRDIEEIVSSSLSENITGSSTVKGKTKSWSVGAAVGVPGKVAVSGGFSKSNHDLSSTASQSAARNLSAGSLQQARERTMQTASSVRSARSTVVQASGQSESLQARTEVVANYNHCHAITIQYFEVLRHFALHNELANVQECLFIPFSITPFDDDKALRWKSSLLQGLPDATLAEGFDAIERYTRSQTQGANVVDIYPGLPNSRFADQTMTSASVRMRLSFRISRPKEIFPDNMPSRQDFLLQPNVQDGLQNLGDFDALYQKDRQERLLDNPADQANWADRLGFVPGYEEIRNRVLAKPTDERDAAFQAEMEAVDWISFFIKRLELSNGAGATLLNDGENGLQIMGRIPYSKKEKMRQGASATQEVIVGVSHTKTKDSNLKRADFNNLLIQYVATGGEAIEDFIPAGSEVKVKSVEVWYDSEHHADFICKKGQQRANLAAGEIVSISAPLNAEEVRNPYLEDLQKRKRLLEHLNTHLEVYHQWIFHTMSDDRRYMMLDGIQMPLPDDDGDPATVEYRSVASLVENRVMGIVGNTMIMPVASGYNLDPKFQWDAPEVTLEDGTKVSPLKYHYMPDRGFKATPFRVSVPTKGVFAEAISGACNSCERIDDSRFWKWEEHPIPDDPTAIGTINTDSRYKDPGNLQAKAMADALISLQKANALPDPSGLTTALNNIAKSNLFQNMTGLDGLMKLAEQSLKGDQAASQEYAKVIGEVMKLDMASKNSDKLNAQIENSGLSEEEKLKLKKENIEGQINGASNVNVSPSKKKSHDGIGVLAGYKGDVALNEDGTLSHWLSKRSRGELDLNGGSNAPLYFGDESYWRRGAKVMWHDERGRSQTIYLDPESATAANERERFMDAYAYDSFQGIKDNFSFVLEIGALYYLDPNGYWAHRVSPHVLPIEMSCHKVKKEGKHIVEVKPKQATTTNSRTLFNGWYNKDKKTGLTWGPYHSKIEVITIRTDKATIVSGIINLFSTPEAFGQKITRVELNRNRSTFNFQNYFLVDSQNRIQLFLKLNGADILGIGFRTKDTADYSSSYDVFNSLEQVTVDSFTSKLGRGGPLTRLFESAFGSVANTLKKLAENVVVDCKVSLDLAMGVLVAYKYSSVNSLFETKYQTFDKVDLVNGGSITENFSLTIYDEEEVNPSFKDEEFSITTLGFETNQSDLTADQKSSIWSQWDELDSKVKDRIRDVENGIQRIQLEGSASNLDQDNSGNETLAINRAQSLIDFLVSDVMGAVSDIAKFNDLVNRKIYHEHQQEPPTDNSKRYRFAQVKFVLK